MFVVEGVRGGTDIGEPYGDICVDDFLLTQCGGENEGAGEVARARS